MNSESLEIQMKYEQQGFITGASARLRSTGYNVILVSNPRVDPINQSIRVWVAMEFDTHVRFLAEVSDLELIK